MTFFRLYNSLRKDFSVARSPSKGDGLEYFFIELGQIFKALTESTLSIYVEEEDLARMYESAQGRPMFLIREFDRAIPEMSSLNSEFYLIFTNATLKSDTYKRCKKIFLSKELPFISVESIFEGKGSVGRKLQQILLTNSKGSFDPPGKIIPYQYNGNTSAKMFYGREKELRELRKRGFDFCLVGARRVGKTSLARAYMREMGKTKLSFKIKMEPFVNRCAYVDVRRADSPGLDRLASLIINAFGLNIIDIPASRLTGYGQQNKDYPTFENNPSKALKFLVDSHSAKGEPLVIILDEVDEWIKIQKEVDDWEPFNFLKAICDDGNAKLILIGYETLDETWRKDPLPLYGRLERLHLKRLDKESAFKLIQEPLLELGIRFGNSDTEKASLSLEIWEVSSGMPNIIQDIGIQLIEFVRKRDERRPIIDKSALSTAISRSSQLRAFVNSPKTSENKISKVIIGIHSCLIKRMGQYEEVDELSHYDETSLEKIGKGVIFDYFNSWKLFRIEDFESAYRYLYIRNMLIPNETESAWQMTNYRMRKAMFDYVKEYGGLKPWIKLELRNYD